MKGLFFAFEGVNGVGKSTVITQIYKKLKNSQYDVYLTQEPSRSFIGKFARENADKINGKPLACLTAADRYFHVVNEIIPKLENNTTVLCDRNILSAYVYNFLDGISYEYTFNLYSGIRYPDAIILLKASIDTVQKRLNKRSNLTRYELQAPGIENTAYYESANYLRSIGIKIIEVSTDCELDTTLNEVYEILMGLLKNRNK